jgi:hypothetical protein
VKIIRDKHAFHYDRDRAKQALILFPESEDLLFFLPQNGVNFFAEFAEDILNWSLFNEKPGISPSDTLNAIMQDVVSLKRHFETFGHQYAECVLQTIEHHGANSEDVDIPTINDVHLPFFVRRNNALEA